MYAARGVNVSHNGGGGDRRRLPGGAPRRQRLPSSSSSSSSLLSSTLPEEVLVHLLMLPASALLLPLLLPLMVLLLMVLLLLAPHLVLVRSKWLQNGQIQRHLLEYAGSFRKRVGVFQTQQVSLQRQHPLGRRSYHPITCVHSLSKFSLSTEVHTRGLHVFYMYFTRVLHMFYTVRHWWFEAAAAAYNCEGL